MQQVDTEKNATNLLNFNQMAVKTIENKATKTTLLLKNVDTKQSEQPLIQDQRVLFLIEFSAGALGGVVSRTAYVNKLIEIFLYFLF